MLLSIAAILTALGSSARVPESTFASGIGCSQFVKPPSDSPSLPTISIGAFRPVAHVGGDRARREGLHQRATREGLEAHDSSVSPGGLSKSAF